VIYLRKSTLYLLNKSNINEKDFVCNFDFINQRIDTYNDIMNKNSKKIENNYVKVKHLKGKR